MCFESKGYDDVLFKFFGLHKPTFALEEKRLRIKLLYTKRHDKLLNENGIWKQIAK